MILIDASNISLGGGKVLLEYLIQHLEAKGIETNVIWKQTLYTSNQENYKHIRFHHCSGPLTRHKTLKQSLQEFHPQTLLCFGNYPPSFKPRIKTITYFHNPYLLQNPIYHIATDPLLFLRKSYLQYCLYNTDHFVFQSGLIKDLFINKYRVKSKQQNHVIPIFDHQKIQEFNLNQQKKELYIYISYPYKHKNHKRLLEAWKLLALQHIFPVLILTIPDKPQFHSLLREIDTIHSLGGRIINLGYIPFHEALLHTAEAKYVIFPSLNETFGLGLIEGAILNCYILAANLPYVQEIIQPSYFFNPYDVSDIARIIQQSINNKIILKTQTVVKNEIERFVELLW